MGGSRLRALVMARCRALAGGGCGAAAQRGAATTTATTTATKTVTATTTAELSRSTTGPLAAATTSTTPEASPGQGTATPDSANHTAIVHDAAGNQLAVTAESLIDPATSTKAGLGPRSGARFVALVLTLTDRGPGTVGRTYTADCDAVNECTSFNFGSYTLRNGDSRHGCVVFQLDSGVSVSSAQFSLGSGTAQFLNHA